MGTRCNECGCTYVPATSFCERCLQALDDWVEVGPVGEVHTFTLLYEDPDGGQRQNPEVVAFVRLGDGGLVHRLGEVDPEALSIGMPVEAVFRPAAERVGAITDIAYFRPLSPT